MLFYTGLLIYTQPVAISSPGWVRDGFLHVFLYTVPSERRGGDIILHRFITRNPGLQTRGYEDGIPSTTQITKVTLCSHASPFHPKHNVARHVMGKLFSDLAPSEPSCVNIGNGGEGRVGR